jgi:PPOX class probable F420-dependent enzyme
MSTLTPELRTFLDTEIIGVLATISAPGRAHQSVVYFARDGEELLISTEAQRHKAGDVRRTRWASLCVMGHERPFPSVTISGPAEIRTEGIGPATAAIAQRVMGVDQAPEPQTDQALAAVGRVILAITTERIGPASYIPE